jgi:lantibiotic modifying enzyme
MDVEAARICSSDAWAWVMDQVRWDSSGPWIPSSVPASSDAIPPSDVDRDSIYAGIGGLAPALAQFRLARDWTDAERHLADGLITRLNSAATGGDCSLYAGLAGSLVAVAVLDKTATGGLLERLADEATATGWPAVAFDEPSSTANDLLLGNAGIVLACIWHGGPLADELAALGAEALVAATRGLAWKMFEGDSDRVMPNYSHGTAGVATALAVAGHKLNRPDFVEAALLGAQHLVSIADVSDGGFRLPHQIPAVGGDTDPYSYGWCHGPTGTAHLFGALQMAGVTSVAECSCGQWRDAATRSVRGSGLPARLRPGFWDNDGRCCGTAGVLEATLNTAQDGGHETHVDFADQLAGALVGRAVESPRNPAHRYWQFREHRVDPPDLDPGVGWMQGAAGIASTLSRYASVKDHGLTAPRLPLPDDWWMVTRTPEAGARHGA